MKSKKGFTLLEVIAVVVIMGLLVVLAVPNVLDAISTSKTKTEEFQRSSLLDAARVYIEDVASNKEALPITSPITVNNKQFTDSIKGYDFKAYLGAGHALYTSSGDVVNKGYFNEGCNYISNINCMFPSDCVIEITADADIKDNYYLINAYHVQFVGECNLLNNN